MQGGQIHIHPRTLPPGLNRHPAGSHNLKEVFSIPLYIFLIFRLSRVVRAIVNLGFVYSEH